MSDQEAEDAISYKVVVNHEEQYSLWPADRENPAGWSDAGKTGLKEECLAHIEQVWTDMRPLSLAETHGRNGLISRADRRGLCSVGARRESRSNEPTGIP